MPGAQINSGKCRAATICTGSGIKCIGHLRCGVRCHKQGVIRGFGVYRTDAAASDAQGVAQKNKTRHAQIRASGPDVGTCFSGYGASSGMRLEEGEEYVVDEAGFAEVCGTGKNIDLLRLKLRDRLQVLIAHTLDIISSKSGSI